MKKIILFVLYSFAAFAQVAKPTGAWLPVHMKWEHAPVSVNPKLETGATTVLYFDEQQRFAVVGCVVNRESGQYTISHGDGQVISLGEWDGHLPGQVKYRLVSRTVALKGETLPGPWHEEKLASTSKGYLRFEGKLYRRVETLEPSVREILHGLTAMTEHTDFVDWKTGNDHRYERDWANGGDSALLGAKTFSGCGYTCSRSGANTESSDRRTRQ